MNRMGRVIVALCVSVGVSMFAADATTGTAPESVDAQIEAIINADPRMRRELMNAFKRRLAEMNRKERMEAISELREKMGAVNTEHDKHASKEREQPMKGMKNVVQTQQSLQMEQTGGAERMNQRQGVDQWAGPHGGAAGTGIQDARGERGGGMPFGR
ncbi:hypothetical protein [Hydrogenimonas sp.]